MSRNRQGRIARPTSERCDCLRERHSSRDSSGRGAPVLTSPSQTREYLRVHLATCERRVFGLIHLNRGSGSFRSRICFTERWMGLRSFRAKWSRLLSPGTRRRSSATTIIPVVRPSPVMRTTLSTRHLKKALELVDVRLLDHLIVGESIYSFAEAGRLLTWPGGASASPALSLVPERSHGIYRKESRGERNCRAMSVARRSRRPDPARAQARARRVARRESGRVRCGVQPGCGQFRPRSRRHAMYSTKGRPRRLTDAQVAEILEWARSPRSARQLAKRYPVSSSTISTIIKGNGAHYSKPSREKRRGRKRQLTPEQVRGNS